MIRVFASIALLLSSITCAPPDDAESRDSRAVRVDSAGIQIVENILGVAPTEAAMDSSAIRLTLDTVATPRIGRADGPEAYIFDRVQAVLPLADGRLVVVDRGKRELIVFDSTGNHLRTLGGPGGGPGEFSALLTAIVVPPDMIKVWDSGKSHLSWFDASEGFIADSSIQVRGKPVGPQLFRWWFLSDSVFAVLSNALQVASDPFRVIEKRTAYVVPIHGDEPATVLQSFPLVSQFAIREGSSRGSPFHPPTLVAVRSGSSPRVFLGGADSTWEIREFDVRGALRRIIRANIARQAVDPAFIERFRQSILTADNSEDYNRRSLDVFMTELPDSTPAIDELHVDPSGRLWVRRWALNPGDRAVYDMFDTDGEWIGTVVKPAELGTLLAIGTDRVFLLYVDEFGVQYVSIHRLREME